MPSYFREVLPLCKSFQQTSNLIARIDHGLWEREQPATAQEQVLLFLAMARMDSTLMPSNSRSVLEAWMKIDGRHTASYPMAAVNVCQAAREVLAE